MNTTKDPPSGYKHRMHRSRKGKKKTRYAKEIKMYHKKKLKKQDEYSIRKLRNEE